MAHFAKVENGVVTQVIVVSNTDTADAQGVEKEHLGAAFCERLLGGEWKQTSYNGNIRYNYAGVGYSYNPIDDAFIAPMPECGHETLLLNDVKRWECAICEADFKQRMASIEG